MPINFTGSYSQDFDTLATTGTSNIWSNDITLPGWSLFNSTVTAITAYRAEDGSSTTGSFYSYGTTSSSDRALGGLGSGGTYFGSPASGAVAGWIAFGATNTTGSTINSLNLSFNGEQWRNGGNTTAQTMQLEYGFGNSFAAVASWTAPGSTYNWTSPVATATPAAVDGNVAGRVANVGGTLSSLNWANNDTLWFRWIERNDTGNDHGLAIDDFSLSTPITPTVNLSVSTNAGTEAGTTAITVTATASSAVTGDQTVNLGVSGTGITAGDYALSNTTITIPNSATTGSVTFTIVDDALVEGTETVTLTISTPSAGITLGATTTQDITITDNDVLNIVNGPNGSPDAVGPTNNNDDFTNKSSQIPANTSPGSSLNPASITFTNTVKNTGTQTANISLLPAVPTNLADLPNSTVVTLSYGGASATYTYNGTAFTFTSSAGFAGGNPVSANNPIQIGLLAVNATANYTVSIDLPPGTPLSTDTNIERGFPVPVTAFIDSNGNGSADDPVKNNTINRVYTGFLQQVKQSRILQGTGPAVQGTDGTLSTTPKQPAPDNIIEYVVQYKNISEAQPASGNGNIILNAGNVVISEDGTLNNWAKDNDSNSVIDTSHVTGSVQATGTIQYFSGNPATNLLGGEQSGTTAVSDVTKYVNTLANPIVPGQVGTFIFRRKVNQTTAAQGINNTANATYEDPNNPGVINTTSNSVSASISAVLPTVTIATIDANAAESAQDPGTFRISRTGSTTNALTVNYTVTGTATNGTDYTPNLTGTATIVAGQSFVDVTITPVDDTTVEGSENVTLNLAANANYILGGTTSATVAIGDNDYPSINLSVSTNTGTEASFSEGAGANAATATITRNGSTASQLTVNLTSSDTTEATVPNSVIIPAGQTSVNFAISAVEDNIVDGSQTATITASAIGFNPVQANVTVTDNDTAGNNTTPSNNNSTPLNLSLTVNPITFSEGAGVNAATATVTRVGNTNSQLIVNLSSNDTSEATVSNSVIIPVGQTATNFTISAVEDNIIDGDQPVTITAAANGFTNAIANLTVTDNDPVEIDDCCACDELEKQVNDTFKGHTFLPGIPPEDLIFGDVNPNFLAGGIGNDTIFGKEGEDLILGNQNKDIINGNEGNDTIFAGKDDDFVRGGKDNDYLSGDLGNDTICGDLGDDTVFGIIGDDILFGNQGDDILNGNQGKDTVYGGEGNDLVRGGKDDDLVAGGIGNDTVYGDMGNDTICGCEGNDLLIGSEGSDIFVLAAGRGSDIITDFVVGEDLLGLINNLTFSNLKIIQGSGNQAADTFVYVSATNEILVSLIGVDASLIGANAIA